MAGSATVNQLGESDSEIVFNLYDTFVCHHIFTDKNGIFWKKRWKNIARQEFIPTIIQSADDSIAIGPQTSSVSRN